MPLELPEGEWMPDGSGFWYFRPERGPVNLFGIQMHITGIAVVDDPQGMMKSKGPEWDADLDHLYDLAGIAGSFSTVKIGDDDVVIYAIPFCR